MDCEPNRFQMRAVTVTSPSLAISRVAAKRGKNIKDQQDWVSRYTLPKAITEAKESLLKPKRAAIKPVIAIPLAKAEKQLKGAVERFRDGKRHMVIKSTVGLGKTHQTAEAMKTAEGNVLWFAPNHRQGTEATNKINSNCETRPALRILGRSGTMDNDEPICKKHDAVKALQDKGLSRYTTSMLCGQPTADKDNKCSHRDSCPYFNQFKSLQKIRVVPHAYLTLPEAALYKYGDFNENVSHQVIDESPLNTLVGRKSIEIEKLVNDR